MSAPPLLGRKREATVNESVSYDPQFLAMLRLLESYTQRVPVTANSRTVRDQKSTERRIIDIYKDYLKNDDSELPILQREKHLLYISKWFPGPLTERYVSLDASQPWIIHWLTNLALLLGATLEDSEKSAISSKIQAAQNPSGGLGGGFGQMAHIAPTYAGLSALFLAGDLAIWSEIDPQKTYNWIMLDLKKEDGSFSMHKGGESDTRSTYCVLCTASMLDIMTPELIKGTAEYIGLCQTYEGGFGGTPFAEAHGGYSFCAVASLCVLGDPKEVLTKYCNFDRLVEWTVSRQTAFEGGFNGRSNKLVDACYSHWVGGIFPFLEMATDTLLFDREALSVYLLGCCQGPRGGFIDKPGKLPDFYHTNYSILGLSHVQHQYKFNRTKYDELVSKGKIDAAVYCYEVDRIDALAEDSVEAIHPVLGIDLDCWRSRYEK